MTAPAARVRSSAWLALLAVALLSWAGVRATVMQARMATSSAPCAGMAGMAMAGAPATGGPSTPGKPTPAKPVACEWCAAAAHAPLETAAVRLDPPVTSVVFARYEAPASLGPRGPPARRPTARGPPASLSA